MSQRSTDGPPEDHTPRTTGPSALDAHGAHDMLSDSDTNQSQLSAQSPRRRPSRTSNPTPLSSSSSPTSSTTSASPDPITPSSTATLRASIGADSEHPTTVTTTTTTTTTSTSAATVEHAEAESAGSDRHDRPSIRAAADNSASVTATATMTHVWPTASDRAHTSLSTSSLARQYPQLPLHTAQQRTTQHHSGALHLPLPEREDSSRPRPITFGTLKKASMPKHTSSLVVPGKKSKMVSLPSYFRHTTFKQHFQPEGAPVDHHAASALWPTEREPSKRRRLLFDSDRRRHMHSHRDSDSSNTSSSGDNSSSNSSGSESGNSSYENESGTSTPKPERRPLRYQLPSRWSTVDKTDKTELSEDDLQVHYTGPGEADIDASSIRANRPIPPQCGVYYYEVLVKSKGRQGYIGIGVCNATVALDRLPGWEPQSWGYHGDDGNSFGGCGNGRPFGPVFTTGDTIGCGVNFRDMSLFYTKNGIYLGVAFRDLKGSLYPTVGMRTSGEIVEANFGQQEFVFNIEDYVKNEKVEAWQALENTLQNATVDKGHMNNLSQSLSQLVLSYMIHHGYSESARQFSSDLIPQPLQRQGSATGSSSSISAEPSNCPPLVIDTERRKVIRNAILAGEIDKAMQLLEKHYPGIMSGNEEMVLLLRCRKFVEMVGLAASPLRKLDQQERDKGKSKSGDITHSMDVDIKESNVLELMDVDQDPLLPSSATSSKVLHPQPETGEQEELEGLGMLKDAIQYGQYLQELYKDNKRQSVQEMLIDTFSVLAYAESREQSPPSGIQHGHSHIHHSHHSHHSHHTRHHGERRPVSREKVASTVNTAILASQHLPTTAPLETVYRQTSTVMSELTRLGVGAAAFFELDF